MISHDPESDQTPNPLTGGSAIPHGLRTAIDHLTLRWPETLQIHQILALLHSEIGPFTECHGNIDGARHALGATYENQVFLLHTPDPQTRSEAIQLILKGSYLTTHDTIQVMDLVSRIDALTSSEPTCTRIDLAIDIFGHTGIQTPKDIMEFTLSNPDWRPYPFKEVEGSYSTGRGDIAPTVYFGSKSSLKRVRYYDKGKKEGTEYPWFRWETQLRKQHAHAHFEALMKSDPADIPNLCRGMSSAVCEFNHTFPELYQLLFTEPITIKPDSKPQTEVDAWINHAHNSYLKHISVASHVTGIPPGELATSLGLFDLKPTYDLENAVSHPRVVAILERLYDSD